MKIDEEFMLLSASMLIIDSLFCTFLVIGAA